MPKSPTFSGLHEPYLDSLRGWAILGVLAVHLGDSVMGLHEDLSRFLDQGQLGVQLFFVVSAYTLCSSADRAGGPDRFDAAGFFLRRILRIAPAYWLAAIAYYVVALLGNSIPANGLPSLIASMLFLNYFQPSWFMSGFPPGGWSIVAEVFFYLSFPVLYSWMRSARHTFFGLAVSLALAGMLRILSDGIDRASSGILAHLAQNATSYFGIVAQLPVFLCGFVAARSNPRALEWRGTPVVVAVLIISACATQTLPSSVKILSFGLLFAALLISLRQNSLRIFVNPILAWLGRISFSMYLIHFIVIRILVRFWPAPLSGPGDLVLLSAATLALTCPLAEISHRCVEMPFVALGRRFSVRRTGDR